MLLPVLAQAGVAPRDRRPGVSISPDGTRLLAFRYLTQAADKGDGKIKFESTTGKGDDKTKAKSEIKGEDMAGMKYLGLKSLTMVSTSCM